MCDTQSPRDILDVAQENWLGATELVFQDAETESGNPITIVYEKHVPSNRTIMLLSVVCRSDNPYPVLIQLETSIDSDTWVASANTPDEFRGKLVEGLYLATKLPI